MPRNGKPVQAGHALLLGALQIGKVIFRALTGNRDFRRAGFTGAQGHDTVLGRAQAGAERLLQVVAADLDKVFSFVLTRLASFALIGAFEEIRAGRGVQARDVFRRVGKHGQVEQAIGGNDGEATFAIPAFPQDERKGEVFAQRDEFGVKREVFAFGVLPAHADFKEVQAVGRLRHWRPRKGPCRR